MDQFDYLITHFIDDNKWINKFDSFFAHHSEFVINNTHLENIINKIKPHTLNKLMLKFINFGFVPSNDLIIKILNKLKLNKDILYFVRILLRSKKNKKIIFDSDTFYTISQKLKTMYNYNYYIWRIIHEKRYLITQNIFEQIFYTDDYNIDMQSNLIKYKHYNVSYNDLINYILNKYKIYPNNDTLLHACRTGNAILYNHSIKYNNSPSIDCFTQMYDLKDFSEKFVKYIIFDIIDNKIIVNNEQLNHCFYSNTKIFNILYTYIHPYQ